MDAIIWPFLQFGSWTYGGNEINVTLYRENDRPAFDFDDYVKNNQWKVTDHYAKRTEK